MGVSYMTALRYMTFSSIVLTYPRILICGFSSMQIVKHQKGITAYLKTDKMLADKLSLAVTIETPFYKVEVVAAKKVNIPNIKLVTDPDASYIESMVSNNGEKACYLDECGVVEENDENDELEAAIDELGIE